MLTSSVLPYQLAYGLMAVGYYGGIILGIVSAILLVYRAISKNLGNRSRKAARERKQENQRMATGTMHVLLSLVLLFAYFGGCYVYMKYFQPQVVPRLESQPMIVEGSGVPSTSTTENTVLEVITGNAALEVEVTRTPLSYLKYEILFLDKIWSWHMLFLSFFALLNVALWRGGETTVHVPSPSRKRRLAKLLFALVVIVVVLWLLFGQEMSAGGGILERIALLLNVKDVLSASDPMVRIRIASLFLMAASIIPVVAYMLRKQRTAQFDDLEARPSPSPHELPITSRTTQPEKVLEELPGSTQVKLKSEQLTEERTGQVLEWMSRNLRVGDEFTPEDLAEKAYAEKLHVYKALGLCLKEGWIQQATVKRGKRRVATGRYRLESLPLEETPRREELKAESQSLPTRKRLIRRIPS